MSAPNQVLPKLTTTNVNLRDQAAGFFAQRRKGANVHEATAKSTKAQQATQGLYDETELPEVTEARQAAHKPMKPLDQSEQRFTLSQLVQRIQEGRRRQQQVIDAGDPDGPDETGWDPQAVTTPKRGASLAAGILAHQQRQQR